MADYITAKRERAVSVQVFPEDVHEGQEGSFDDPYCTLTIVGELDPTKIHWDPVKQQSFRVPPEWQGVYNVKYQLKCKIDWNATTPPINNKSIIFKGKPEIQVEEVTSPYYDIKITSSSDAYVTQSEGILNISSDTISDNNGNNIANPDNYGTVFTFSSGSTGITYNPILSQSVVETQTQSLEIPIIGDIGTNALDPFLQSFENITGGNQYSSSYLAPFDNFMFNVEQNGVIQQRLVVKGHVLDKVKPGMYIQINNEIIQLGAGEAGDTSIGQVGYEGNWGSGDQTYLYLMNPSETPETSRGRFKELGFDASMPTHADNDQVKIFYATPWMSTRRKWDTSAGTNAAGNIEPVTSVANFGSLNQTIVGNDGSYFLKHTANSEDHHTRQWKMPSDNTYTTPSFVPILDSYGGSGKIIGKDQQGKDIRLLSYKILVEKFNKKYSVLSDSQRDLLKEYINNISNTNGFDEYIISESKKVKKELQYHISNISEKVAKIKVNESLKQLDGLVLGKKSIEDKVVSLMRYYELNQELFKANSEK